MPWRSALRFRYRCSTMIPMDPKLKLRRHGCSRRDQVVGSYGSSMVDRGIPALLLSWPLQSFANVFDDLDIYTLDHRGVGVSERFSCPDQEAEDSELGREISEGERDACIAQLLATYGDNLDAFSTTESARDLGRLIEATRQPGQQVFVWGVSYGAFLVNRYLQLFPDQPSGIIIDGIVPADWSFSEFDAGVDLIGRRLLDRCAQDPTCSSFLGPNPEMVAEDLIQKWQPGTVRRLG